MGVDTRCAARGPLLFVLAQLVLLVGAGAPVPVAVGEAEDAAVAPLLGELERARRQRDVAGGLALFAPDAGVRERRGDGPPHGWDTRSPRVVRGYRG